MRPNGPLSNFLTPLQKRWYLVLICVALAAITATRYLYMTRPVYQASATLKITSANGGELTQPLAHSAQAEAEVLKSRKLFSQALNKLDFYVEYFKQDDLGNKEVYGNTPFLVSYKILDPQFTSQQYQIRPAGNNSFLLDFETAGIACNKSGIFGQSIKTASLEMTISKNEQFLKFHPKELEGNWSFAVYSPNGLTAHLLNEKYQVQVAPNAEQVIRIYYSHPIPEKAIKLVNAISATYTETSQQSTVELANNSSFYIDTQLKRVGAELDQSRKALQDFRSRNQLINISQYTESTYKTLGELEIQRLNVDMQLNELELLSDYLRKNKEIQFTGPDLSAISNPLFAESVARLNKKLRERNELGSSVGTGKESIKSIDSDIAQQKAFLVESVNNTRRKLYGKQEDLEKIIAAQKASVQGIPAEEATLMELNRAYTLNEKIYNYLLEKKTELLIAGSINAPVCSVIEPATIIEEQTSPKPKTVWEVFILTGLLVGIALAYLRQYMKPMVSVPEDLSTESSIHVIGQVEAMQEKQPAYKAFTALSTRILMHPLAGEPQVISITSTHRGEGKSFLATNLARTFAAMDKKVILLDLNTYHPCLNQWFDARGEAGISEVYNNEQNLQDVIQLTSIPNLDLISAGHSDSPISHLISSGKTKLILDELRRSYDTIIIDTPEVGEYTDAIPFMKWSDLNLYVVRADGERDQLVANAEQVKEEYRLNEVHFVLNAMKEKRNHTGYSKQLRQATKVSKKSPILQLTNLFMW